MTEYKNAVCRGDLILGNGCRRCEKCIEQRARLQAREAEKSDAHQFHKDAIVTDKLTAGSITAVPAYVTDIVNASQKTPEQLADLKAKSVAFERPDPVKEKLAQDLGYNPSPIDGHVKGLPVAGYQAKVDQWKIDLVNENKILEEKVLRRIDEFFAMFDAQPEGENPPEHQPCVDKRSVAIARTHIEDAFYRLNRAVMRPQRIKGDLK